MLGINVYNRDQHDQVVCEGPVIWVGRAGCAGRSQAFVNDPLVQQKHLQIKTDQGKDDTIELINYGRTVLLTSGLRVFRNVKKKLKLPVEFWIGESFVSVFSIHQGCPIDYAISALPVSLSSGDGFPNADQSKSGASEYSGAAPSAATLSMWFDAFAQLQRSVAGSQAFFCEAARSVFDPGGLDAGIILLKEGDDWNVAASYVPNPELGTTFRPDLIDRVLCEKVTLFHDTTQMKKSSSGGEYSAVVVAPVFDALQNVTGVVYGLRGQHRKNYRRGVRPMEAHFVQLVAEAVSAGLIRLEREAEAARDKVLLDQAFSPQVVKHIANHPEALDGQQREVSVLFADVRQFSNISEKIGSRLTFQLLGDVMDQLTAVVNEHDGVVIDYYGDGIAAFWNAPVTQGDHANLACSAALEMLKTLPTINSKWADQIGQFLRIGVGVHTGLAQVGNSGSKRRIKYGPRGQTVNLASRIESATKSIGVPLLISHACAEKLNEKFINFSMGSFELPGIAQPQELFRVFDPHMDVRKLEFLRSFESAVKNVETGNLAAATETMIQLQGFNQNDNSLDWLANRISQLESCPSATLAPCKITKTDSLDLLTLN